MKKYAASAATTASPAYTQAGALQVDPALGRLDQAEDAGAADDHRQAELDHRDAEVAAGRVEAERGALAWRPGRRS